MKEFVPSDVAASVIPGHASDGPPTGPAQAAGHTAIFLHIPKTAGSTLSDIVLRQYGGGGKVIWLRKPRISESAAQFAELPDQRKRELRMVLGHVGYGLHEMTPNRCTYVTVLREPVDRVVSYYYYILRQPRHFMYEDTRKLTLKEFAASEVSHKVANGQTKYLAEMDAKECTRETFETAKRHLESFAVVGLIERFDETLMLMKRALGWGMPFYVRENVTKNRPRVSEIGADVREVIEKYNAFDIELYAWAAGRYEQTIRREGLGLKCQVAAFRALNRLYAPYRAVKRKLSRRAAAPPAAQEAAAPEPQ